MHSSVLGASRRSWPGWLVSALVAALGGIAASLGTVLVAQIVASLLNGGRVLESGESAFAALLAAWLLAGVLGYLTLRYALGWSRARTWVMLGLWLLGYLLVWLIGATASGLSLPLFAALWLGYGVLAGLLHGRLGAARSSPAAAPTRARSRATGPAPVAAPAAAAGRFGRVPAAAVAALREDVAAVGTLVASALPGSTPQPVRDDTTRLVLDRVIRDRWRRGYRRSLSDADRADLAACVAVARGLAGAEAGGAHAFRGIHRAVLTALLDAWLAHRA